MKKPADRKLYKGLASLISQAKKLFGNANVTVETTIPRNNAHGVAKDFTIWTNEPIRAGKLNAAEATKLFK